MRENKAPVFRLIVVIATDEKSLFSLSCIYMRPLDENCNGYNYLFMQPSIFDS